MLDVLDMLDAFEYLGDAITPHCYSVPDMLAGKRRGCWRLEGNINKHKLDFSLSVTVEG